MPRLYRFERAKRAMDDCKHMPSPEESEEHRSLMIRLYVNLAVCSNKKKEYKRACTNCRMALELEPGNAKAHYKLVCTNTHLNVSVPNNKNILQLWKCTPKFV
jgi:hypothetical protein